MLAGFLGVIGSVNFSLSPGVIVASGAASRYTLLPTSAGLLALSFLPKTIAVLGSIPSVIIGSSLIYLMCSQIAAGLQLALGEEYKFDYGLVMGLPLMLSVITSYLPSTVLNTFPPCSNACARQRLCSWAAGGVDYGAFGVPPEKLGAASLSKNKFG